MSNKSERQRPFSTSKKHLARQEKERRQTRLILIGAITVSIFVVLIIAIPFFIKFVIEPGQPVAIVNTEEISTRDWQLQTRYYRYNIIRNIENSIQIAQLFGNDPNTLSSFTGQIQSLIAGLEPLSAGQAVLDEMINNVLIIQEATSQNIIVTDEEIEREFQAAFGYYADGTPTPTSTIDVIPTSTLTDIQKTLVPQTPTSPSSPTPDSAEATPQSGSVDATPTNEIETTPTASPTAYTFDGYQTYSRETLAAISDIYGISSSDLTEGLRYSITAQLYRDKLIEAQFSDFSCAENQVWARHILVEDIETAQEVIDKIDSSDDFCSLASEYSIDTSNKDTCGDLDWFGTGKMVQEFEDAAFALEVGEISEPIETQFGFHIIQSLGNEERTLDQAICDQNREQSFNEWLMNTYSAADIEIFDYWLDRIVDIPTLPIQTQLALEQLFQPAPTLLPTEQP